MVRKSRVLGKISVNAFLADYWQREPLVVRGAFPRFRDPLTPDELAGLSCESSVDSRLVRERGGRKPWQVTRGPQKAQTLKRLGASHWTLLVESMDRHSDEIAGLASAFSFLPRWRMDDVMVSLAPVHGTVDAHIDSYDVFLVQGRGKRRWEVDRKAVGEYRPGLDLRILRRFGPQDSWVLEPGDMLYVPPGVGHRGVTVPSEVEIALTYSVGFRAPSSTDLLASLLSRSMTRDAQRLFSDRGRRRVADRGELAATDIAALREFLIREIDAGDEETWPRAAGEAVTAGGGVEPSSSRLSASRIARSLQAGARISPASTARVAWCRLPGGRAALFVNGESRVLPRRQAFAASLICGRHTADAGRRLAAIPELVALVVDLAGAGVISLPN